MNYSEWLREVRDSLRNDYQCSESEIDFCIDNLARCEGVYLNDLYHAGWSTEETAEHLGG